MGFQSCKSGSFGDIWLNFLSCVIIKIDKHIFEFGLIRAFYFFFFQKKISLPLASGLSADNQGQDLINLIN